MHTTSIQKLFILLIFANTQVYATNVSTIKDLSKKPVNVDALYDQYLIEPEKKKLSQSLLEKQDYNGLKKERNKWGKQVRRIARTKKLSKGIINQEDQELLDTDKKLGKKIQNVEQQVAKEVSKKYPYSGRKGFEARTNTRIAEIKREHATWVENRQKKIKEKERIKKEFFANERAERRREEKEFINSLQVQPSNSNSNSNKMNLLGEYVYFPTSAMAFSVSMPFVCFFNACSKKKKRAKTEVKLSSKLIARFKVLHLQILLLCSGPIFFLLGLSKDGKLFLKASSSLLREISSSILKNYPFHPKELSFPSQRTIFLILSFKKNLFESQKRHEVRGAF